MSMKPRRITTDQIHAILAMYRKGVPMEKIRVKFRMSFTTVRTIVRHPEQSIARAAAGGALATIVNPATESVTPEWDDRPPGIVRPAPPLANDRVPVDLAARAARVMAATDSRRIIGPVHPHSVPTSNSPAGLCAEVGGNSERGAPWR
jgi:hypothetical protein